MTLYLTAAFIGGLFVGGASGVLAMCCLMVSGIHARAEEMDRSLFGDDNGTPEMPLAHLMPSQRGTE